VAIAERLRLPFPIYSMIAAVIDTDLSAAQTRRLGAPRVAGTLIGGAVGAALISMLQPGPVAAMVGIMSAMLISHLLRLSDAAAKVAGYVSGVVLLEHGSQPWLYAWLRLIEMLLGIVAAILVAFLPRLLRTEPHDSKAANALPLMGHDTPRHRDSTRNRSSLTGSA
jgi:uncharacterized membrane protein YgaE (UPF0421/DUF939 family)